MRPEVSADMHRAAINEEDALLIRLEVELLLVEFDEDLEILIEELRPL